MKFEVLLEKDLKAMESLKNGKRNRSSYWQIIRGICILAVVSIHCPNAMGLDHTSVQFWLYFSIRQLTNFPVAVFLFMAGYFTKIEKWKEKPLNELRFRVQRLLIPYFIWSAVYIVVKCVFETRMGMKEIVAEMLLGKAATPFYYVLVLIQLTFLVVFLCWTISNKKWWYSICICSITPIALVVLYACVYKQNSIPWYCNTLFPVWLLFFYLGIACRMNSKRCRVFFSRIGKWWVVVILCGINYLEAVCLLDDVPRLATSQNRFGAYLYSLALIAFVFNCSDGVKMEMNKIQSAFRWIGDNSFALFWIHCLVLEVVKRLIGKFVNANSWILNYTISFFATITISVIVIAIVKKTAMKIGVAKQLYIIGFD